jgi:DNA-binding transcriptional MerR regulator
MPANIIHRLHRDKNILLKDIVLWLRKLGVPLDVIAKELLDNNVPGYLIIRVFVNIGLRDDEITETLWKIADKKTVRKFWFDFLRS